MWVPASDAHAIESVSLAFVFSEPVPLKLLDASLTHVDDALGKGIYKSRSDVSASNIHFKMGVANELISQSDKMGYAYFVDQERTVEGARFTKELAVISSSAYATWGAFKEEYEQIVVPFLGHILVATSVRAIKLEYSDRFVFHGDRADANVSDVVHIAKLGLPNDAFGKGYPWHSRRGWFTPAGNGSVLVNLDVSEALVAHRDVPETPLLSVHLGTVLEARVETSVDDLQQLNLIVDQLHDQSKSVTRAALTKNAAEMIGLSDVV